MKRKAIKVAVVFSLASIYALSSCSSTTLESAATAETTSIKISSSGTNEPTETVAVTMNETTAAFAAVTILSVPVTYAAAFDNVRLYDNETRTTIQAILKKGERVTITGTADKYGVTGFGYYVNLNLMTITVDTMLTPEETVVPAETTRDLETSASKEPVTTTKAPAATTKATAATTAAPPVETAPPQTAAPAYAENCDSIKSQIIAQLQAKGLWYPDAEVIGNDLIQLSVGYGNADDQYATAYVNGKYGQSTTIGATSVSVWIEGGYLNMSSTKCALPAA